ncbi:hypothetical protein JOC69_000131 [Heliobacterium gestii]|nr:hypothetical protein [Heliomicrobium gestii]
MYVVATFEQSLFLELALSELEEKGISKENILAVPLKMSSNKGKIMDTIYRADGISIFDGATVLGSAAMVLGVIYGYVLAWGPIIWGLIGLTVGFIVGLLLDLAVGNKRKKQGNAKADVVVMISCTESQVDWVSTVLENHHPNGIGFIPD